MLWILVLTATPSTIQLGPPQPVWGPAVLRLHQGLERPHLDIASILKRCTAQTKVPRPTAAVQIRMVRKGWLDQTFKPPKGHHRRGRYYPARNGHEALIYAEANADLARTIAHEWLHHLESVYGLKWTERGIETRARRCATSSSP